MAETTIRPVFIRYDRDVDGYLAGATFEIPTPEQAWAQHPNAHIIRYADGDNYVHGRALKEVRERDRVEDEDAPKGTGPVKRRKGSVTRTKKNKGQDTDTVLNVVPAAPDVAQTMLTDDLTNEDGEPVVVEVVNVPEQDPDA